ncbi:MAG TPA: hypothetical protein VF657_22580 [Actinoplanes sp.]
MTDFSEGVAAMADLHGQWPGAATPPPGWLPPHSRPPVEPFVVQPERPRFREPYPIGAGPLLAGIGAGLLWVVIFGSLGGDLFGYAWWTMLAAVTAWIVSGVLAFLGDRGVAVGVAISAGLGWSVAAAFVASRWISTGDWPMW